MARNKYGQRLDGLPKDFWKNLMSLEAYVGVVISPVKFASSDIEFFKLIHFIYWIAPPPEMTFEEAVAFVKSTIEIMPRPDRRRLQNAARSKIHGLNRFQIRGLVNGRAPTGKKTDFYKSWEWRTLRMQVLQKAGRRCQCCGSTPADFDVNGRPIKLVVDHIKPLSKHWDLRLDPQNLQVLCDECNQGKGAWDQTDWRQD